jgi:hypothetical protein
MSDLKAFLISLIRPLFIQCNGGVEPNHFIQNLWAESSPDQLYTILCNFQRLTDKL